MLTVGEMPNNRPLSQNQISADRGHSAGCTHETGARATGPIAAIQRYRELTGVG
jgi:hypothetical protein